jgi:hypothetical protein
MQDHPRKPTMSIGDLIRTQEHQMNTIGGDYHILRNDDVITVTIIRGTPRDHDKVTSLSASREEARMTQHMWYRTDTFLYLCAKQIWLLSQFQQAIGAKENDRRRVSAEEVMMNGPARRWANAPHIKASLGYIKNDTIFTLSNAVPCILFSQSAVQGTTRVSENSAIAAVQHDGKILGGVLKWHMVVQEEVVRRGRRRHPNGVGRIENGLGRRETGSR